MRELYTCWTHKARSGISWCLCNWNMLGMVWIQIKLLDGSNVIHSKIWQLGLQDDSNKKICITSWNMAPCSHLSWFCNVNHNLCSPSPLTVLVCTSGEHLSSVRLPKSRSPRPEISLGQFRCAYGKVASSCLNAEIKNWFISTVGIFFLFLLCFCLFIFDGNGVGKFSVCHQYVLIHALWYL